MKKRGCEVQTLRTDQGSVYNSNEISSILKTNGFEIAPKGRDRHAHMQQNVITEQ